MANDKNKIYALDLSNEEWIVWLKENLEQPKFRAAQITQWLWQKRVYDAEEMTNLSKELRDALKDKVDFALPELLADQRSQDGTRKFLWRFSDGQTVESVLLKQGDRLTACISTQVGCPLQCVFCATGLSGYERNLSAGEIAAQFLAMEKIVGRDIANVVYMGMGEPFLNTDNVLKSVWLLNDSNLRNLGIRHITISTSGVIPGIMRLANSGLGVRLAISLHAVEDELRSELMPINERYPLAELRKAMEEYQKITGDRITIEYALFGGVNDSVEDARELVRYLRGIHVFVNLIPFNAVEGRFEKPSPESVLKFRKILDTAGFETFIREEQGADIDAACGQLRRKTSAGKAIKLDVKPYEVEKREPKPKAPARKAPEKSRTARSAKPQDSKEKTSRAKKPADRFPKERDAAKSRPPREEKTGPAKRGKTDKPEEGRKSNFSKERDAGKSRPPRDEKTGPAKRRKTDKPEEERYRSGKMKEERPTYRGKSGEGEPKRERKAAWFEGATTTRKKAKKPASPTGRQSKATKQAKKKK